MAIDNGERGEDDEYSLVVMLFELAVVVRVECGPRLLFDQLR
jgi:hypothetical protein